MQADAEKQLAEKREEKILAAVKAAQKENEELKQKLEKTRAEAAQLQRRAAEAELEASALRALAPFTVDAFEATQRSAHLFTARLPLLQRLLCVRRARGARV